MRIGTVAWVFGDHAEGYAAACHELSLDSHPARLAGLYEVIQDFVNDRLVERVDVAVRRQVELQRFGLKTERVGNVIDENLGEVGLTRDGAKRSEIRTIQVDSVIAARLRIGEGFDLRLLGRFWERRIGSSEQSQTWVFLVPEPFHSTGSVAGFERSGNEKAASASDSDFKLMVTP